MPRGACSISFYFVISSTFCALCDSSDSSYLHYSYFSIDLHKNSKENPLYSLWKLHSNNSSWTYFNVFAAEFNFRIYWTVKIKIVGFRMKCRYRWMVRNLLANNAIIISLQLVCFAKNWIEWLAQAVQVRRQGGYSKCWRLKSDFDKL